MSVIGELLLAIGVDSSSWSTLTSTLDQGSTAIQSFADDASEAGAAMDSALGSSVANATQQLQNLGAATDPVAQAQADLAAAFASTGVSMDTLDSSSSALRAALEEMGISVDDVAEPLQNVSDAAETAAPAMGDLADSADHAAPAVSAVGDSSDEASGGMKELAEQMAAVGEALVITEGLKEFGQEALTAYGTVQSVTIGLTALTGSAEQADSIIEQVKNLAATEPFAFPEIAPTVQRMVALGVSTEQIPVVMRAAADAAAATGNDFGNVANMLDRMAISGTANSRALATLGISTQDLANAMGVTADAATKAFKALDQSDRIDVLSQALQKFSGTAIAEAQGIAGQWQIFQNQFEEVMVNVGAALAPVVSDILAFGKGVLSALQDATEAFGELPRSIQDGVVAVGLMVAALVPLAAGLAAVGIGVAGLQSLPVVFGQLSESLGITSAAEETLAETATTATAALEAQEVAAGGASVAVGASGEAMATFGAASQAAGVEVAGAGEAVEGLGVAAATGEGALVLLGAAIAAVQAKQLDGDATDLGTTLTGLYHDSSDLTGAVGSLQDSFFGLMQSTNTMKESDDTLHQSWAAVKEDWSQTRFDVVPGLTEIDDAIKRINSDIQIATNDWPAMNAAVNAGLSSLESANQKLTETAAAAGIAGQANTTMKNATDALVTSVQKQETALANAKLALQGVEQGDQEAGNYALLHAAAVDAVTKAQNALNVTSGASKASLAALAKDGFDAVTTSARTLEAEYTATAATFSRVLDAYNAGKVGADALGIATENLQKASDAYNKSLQQTPQYAQDATDALQAAITKFKSLSDAAGDGTTSNLALITSFNSLGQAAADMPSKLTPAQTALKAVADAAIAAAGALPALNQGFGNLTINGKAVVAPLTEAGVGLQGTTTLAQQAAAQLPNTASAFTFMGTSATTAGVSVGSVGGYFDEMSGKASAAATALAGTGSSTVDLGTKTDDLTISIQGTDGAVTEHVQGITNLNSATGDASEGTDELDLKTQDLTTTITNASGTATVYTASITNTGAEALTASDKITTLYGAVGNLDTGYQALNNSQSSLVIGMNSVETVAGGVVTSITAIGDSAQQAAGQAQQLASALQSVASAGSAASGKGGSGGKGNTAANNYGSVGNLSSDDFGLAPGGSASQTLGYYAAVGASGGVLDQIAQGLGYIPVGQNSYDTVDQYNQMLKATATAGNANAPYEQLVSNGVGGYTVEWENLKTAVTNASAAATSNAAAVSSGTTATQANTTAQQLQTAATTATETATTNQTVSTNDLGTATAGAVTSQTQLAVATQGGSVALTDSLIPSLNAAGVATAGLTSTQLANTDALTLQAQAMGVVTESGSFYETELQSLGVTMQTNSDGTETWGGNLANVQTAQDDLNSALANAINEMRTANSAQTDLASSIGDTGDASGTSATSVGDLTSQVTDVGNAASGAAQAMDQLGASLANLGGGTSIGGSGGAPTGSGPQPAGTFNAATYVGLLPYGQLTTQEQGQLGSDTSQGQIVNFWDQMGTVTPVIEGFTEALGKIQPVIDGLTLNQGGVTGTIPGNSPQEILQSAAGLGSGIYNEVLAILEAQGYVPQVSGAVQGPPITNATPNSPSPLPTVNTATYVPGGIQDSATTTTAQPVAGGGAATVNVTLPGAQITSMSTAQTFLAQMAYQMRSIVKF